MIKRLNYRDITKGIPLNLQSNARKVSGYQVVIMEVLGKVGKLLKILLPDKIENRKAEVHKQALDLRGIVTRNIVSMDIQYKVGDAPNLQSGGGLVGAWWNGS